MTAGRRSQDRKRVAGGQDYEFRYEAKKTGTSKSRVKRRSRRLVIAAAKWSVSSAANVSAAMSRAFVKEDAVIDDVVDRPISPHPNYVTVAGLEQIERALEIAQQAHGAAQASGDHRADLAKASSDLRYWTARRSSARLVTPDPTRNTVQFGSAVTIVRHGRKQVFRLVGEDEAEPAKGKISYVSPLARAVMNKEVGETAMLGESEIEIVAISLA